jgi:hypothetical protein
MDLICETNEYTYGDLECHKFINVIILEIMHAEHFLKIVYNLFEILKVTSVH